MIYAKIKNHNLQEEKSTTQCSSGKRRAKGQAHCSLKALDAFIEKFHDRIDQSYLIHTKDLRMDSQVTLVPIPMTPLL